MLDLLVRAGYRLLNPTARNALRTWLVLEARDGVPQAIRDFNESRVLVIAPHSDDEVVGCGGVIARHVRGGSLVDVVFMTDGRWGDGELFSSGLVKRERIRRQDALIETRKREARAAAAVLGTHALHFLGLPDGALRADPAAISALKNVLDSVRPDLVYLPFVYDLHEDHWQTNLVFAGAVALLGGRGPSGIRVRGYEVWTPLLANRVADISEVMPLKREALTKFASQLRDQNYLRTVEGLNMYRASGAFGGLGFAEAFHETSLLAYLRLVRAAMLKHATLRDAAVPAAIERAR